MKYIKALPDLINAIDAHYKIVSHLGFDHLIEEVLMVMESWEVPSENAASLLRAVNASSNNNLKQAEIESIVSVMEEIESDQEDYGYGDYEDAGDMAFSSGRQYYQNAAGKCEDAPCCGCCGMM